MENSKPLLITLLVLVVILLVGGGLLFYFQFAKIDDVESNLNVKISKIKVTELEETSTTPATETKIVETECDEQKSFLDIFQEYEKYPMDKSESDKLKIKDFRTLEVDNCPPSPDGPCGYNLIIAIDKDIEIFKSKPMFKEKLNTFYLIKSEGGPGVGYFGPFSGNLEQIWEELMDINGLKVSQ